jgi:hypothetical protein
LSYHRPSVASRALRVIRFVVVTGLVGAGARAAEAPPVTVAPGFVTTLSVQIIVGTGREVSVRIYDGSDKSTTESYLCSRTTCVPSQVVTERPERQPGKAAPPAEP